MIKTAAHLTWNSSWSKHQMAVQLNWTSCCECQAPAPVLLFSAAPTAQNILVMYTMSAQTACTRIQHASVLLLATAFSLVTMLVGSEHHDSIMDRYSLLLEANALHNLEKIVAMQGAWNSQENFKIRGARAYPHWVFKESLHSGASTIQSTRGSRPGW